MAKDKIWSKGGKIDERIETFTIGQDRALDIHLAEFDILGSLAHVQMLHSIGVVNDDEWPIIKSGLLAILKLAENGQFKIEDGVEDVHSQVEKMLIEKVGPLGGKIHTGRSRNDQVLLDLKLYYRKKLDQLSEKLNRISLLFIEQARKYESILMPGYTHTQVAMTSSFGMWFAAFAEAFSEDAQYLDAIFPIINKNPLGSAAGYGSSFPLNRAMTTSLLGFENMHYNPINAQYNRGKSELIMAQSLSNICVTINKLSTDLILYSNENYRFLSLPREMTTGSSIMPHKKNPDVFELIRAHSNIVLNLPGQIAMLISNLTTGYHRDFQLLKEYLFPALQKVEELLDLIAHTLPRLKINEEIVNDEKYRYLLTVDAVNELVIQGLPFREAYLRVGQQIEKGEFAKPSELKHTHEGSIGNLCLDIIEKNIIDALEKAPYQQIRSILSKLRTN